MAMKCHKYSASRIESDSSGKKAAIETNSPVGNRVQKMAQRKIQPHSSAGSDRDVRSRPLGLYETEAQ